MKTKKTAKLLSLFLLFQIIAIQSISFFPDMIESYYSRGLYVFISKINRLLFGWITFSVGDILYAVIIGYVLYLIIKSLKDRKIKIYNCIAFVSIIYFMFNLFWGLNYHRIHLTKQIEIENLAYDVNDLENFSNHLVHQINKIQKQITKSDSIKVTVPYSTKEIYNLTKNGYQHLNNQYTFLKYEHSSIKSSLYSLPLTYAGFSGYFNPFTHEAQVNACPPKFLLPTVSCHEVAHQIGYAAENEANLIGVLTSISNDDLYFKYSGYYLALRYTLRELYKLDKTRFNKLYKQINSGITKNFRESEEFWNSYENPMEVYFKNIFNLFLKANNQNEGIKSYNLMVGMLINYSKKENSILKQ